MSYLPLIDAITNAIARRHHLSAADRDDFASLVRVKLLEHDSAVLRKFAGRSSARTFLTTVIQRIFLDDRNSRWGKWRPSAEARRAGPAAMLFERLVSRDGLSFEEAGSTLRITHRLPIGEAELDALRARLPTRVKRQVVRDAEVADVLPASDAASPALPLYDAEEQRRHDLEAALAGSIAGLPVEDRLILRLRFEQGLTVAAISRMTGTDQRLMYRRLENLLAGLRAALERAGFASAEALGILEGVDVSFDGLFEGADENARSRPSTQEGPAARRKDKQSGPAA